MTLRRSVTPDDAIRLLNELNELDPEMMKALIGARVPCNQAVADHPTVQVTDYNGPQRLGLLGVINGLFGVDEYGWGAIAAHYDDPDGRVFKFQRTNPTAAQHARIAAATWVVWALMMIGWVVQTVFVSRAIWDDRHPFVTVLGAAGVAALLTIGVAGVIWGTALVTQFLWSAMRRAFGWLELRTLVAFLDRVRRD